MKKQEILNKIAETVRFSIADSNTYLYVKCIPGAEKADIGGGNFTVLLATLVCIEFLGTINAILDGDSTAFWSQDEIDEINTAKKKIKIISKKESVRNFLLAPFNRVPEEGNLIKGTRGCIGRFLKETKALTGLRKENIEKLCEVRNKLAHEFTPKIIPAAGIPFSPKADFQTLIRAYRRQDVFCLTTTGEIGIDSNALNQKLHYLLQYVIEKFEKADKEKLKKIETYLKEIK